MKTEEKVPVWAGIAGAILVASILLLIALNAIGGWAWTSGFLLSAAPGWVQAIGALAAIYAAWRIASDQRSDKAEAEKAMAHITLLRLLKGFRQLSALQVSVAKVMPTLKAASAAVKANEVLDQVLAFAEVPTDDQLLRVAVLHPNFIKHYAEALTTLESLRLTVRLSIGSKLDKDRSAVYLDATEEFVAQMGRSIREAERLLPNALKEARPQFLL